MALMTHVIRTADTLREHWANNLLNVGLTINSQLLKIIAMLGKLVANRPTVVKNFG